MKTKKTAATKKTNDNRHPYDIIQNGEVTIMYSDDGFKAICRPLNGDVYNADEGVRACLAKIGRKRDKKAAKLAAQAKAMEDKRLADEAAQIKKAAAILGKRRAATKAKLKLVAPIVEQVAIPDVMAAAN